MVTIIINDKEATLERAVTVFENGKAVNGLSGYALYEIYRAVLNRNQPDIEPEYEQAVATATA